MVRAVSCASASATSKIAMASALHCAAMMAVDLPMPVAAPVMMMRLLVRSAGICLNRGLVGFGFV